MTKVLSFIYGGAGLGLIVLPFVSLGIALVGRFMFGLSWWKAIALGIAIGAGVGRLSGLLQSMRRNQQP